MRNLGRSDVINERGGAEFAFKKKILIRGAIEMKVGCIRFTYNLLDFVARIILVNESDVLV